MMRWRKKDENNFLYVVGPPVLFGVGSPSLRNSTGATCKVSAQQSFFFRVILFILLQGSAWRCVVSSHWHSLKKIKILKYEQLTAVAKTTTLISVAKCMKNIWPNDLFSWMFCYNAFQSLTNRVTTYRDVHLRYNISWAFLMLYWYRFFSGSKSSIR